MPPTSTIVTPIKGLHSGKSRLAHLMAEGARADLNRYLAERTLKTVAELAGISEVYVVSPDPEVGEIAGKFAAKFLLQKTDGLNPGLDQAAREVPERRTVYLAADLPDLTVDDLEALISEMEIGISPDQFGRGTNALSVPTPRAIDFRFGADSFKAHCGAALKAGFRVSIIDRPGLAFDLDTEKDLERIKGWSSATNPRSVRR